MLKLSTSIPPIYKSLREKFGVDFEKDCIMITVGDVCYCNNPNVFEERSDLRLHEIVHQLQQENMGVSQWWNKYLEDPDFRLEQELNAYKIQWEYLKSVIPDRNKRYVFKKNICDHLSGKMYGGLMSYTNAWRMFN